MDRERESLPELFTEFVNTGENGQAELLHQLKLINVNTHKNESGRSFYGWNSFIES